MELAYIVGVRLSDGYSYRKKEWRYKNGLDAKDREYVKRYSYCMARLLGRKRNRIRLRNDRMQWRVEYGSVAFYTWLKQQTLDSLEQCIEHCEECQGLSYVVSSMGMALTAERR